MWLNYWLLASVLLAAGALIYVLGLRWWLGARHAKWAIRSVLVCSVGLPLLLPAPFDYSRAWDTRAIFDYKTYREWNVVDISDADLLRCYADAKKQGDLCRCEVIQKSNLLVFNPDPMYNTLLDARAPLWWGFGLVAAWVLGRLLLRVGALYYWAKAARRRLVIVDNQQIWLLYTPVPFGVASFRLWEKYVLWSEEMDALPADTQRLVLLHEAAHLRQADTWQQLLVEGLQGLWWMHPFYYILKKELGKLNEFVADEQVIAQTRQPRRYARTLVELKETQFERRWLAYAWAMARGLLHQRVSRIVGWKPSPMRPWGYALSVVAVCVALAGLLWKTGEPTRAWIDSETLALRQYELLRAEHQKTGLRFFCRDCFQQVKSD